MGFFSSIKKAVKDAGASIKSETKKAEATVAANANKVVKAVETAAKKVLSTAEDVPFALLLPFKNTMVTKLDGAHIGHDGSLHDVVMKFAQHVSQFKNFETNYFDRSNGSLYNVDSGTVVNAAGSIAAGAANGGAVGAASAAITAIIAYFKGLQAKKAAGTKLSPEEEKALAGANLAANGVMNATKGIAEDAITVKIKDFLFSWKGLAALVAIVAILVFGFRASKAKKAKTVTA